MGVDLGPDGRRDGCGDADAGIVGSAEQSGRGEARAGKKQRSGSSSAEAEFIDAQYATRDG
ncbi:hypothetical protein D3C76_1457800 [compost metagenome]